MTFSFFLADPCYLQIKKSEHELGRAALPGLKMVEWLIELGLDVRYQ